MSNQQNFFQYIQQQHPDAERFDVFLSACERPLRKSIRVNTLKISLDDFKRLANKRDWILEPIPWCEEGFWIEEPALELDSKTRQLGNSGEHLTGLFYIQEASSMLPAQALLNKPDSITETFSVLDMAAAPGSKTTQLAALMQNRGTLLANELSASRIKVLHANLQRLSVTNTCLSHLDGTVLDGALLNEFDAILLDAPCGGEGTYRKDKKALDNWSLEAIASISNLQRRLIRSAWNMLKPGGRLVYSTCTLSRAENHDVIQSLLDDFSSDACVINLSDLFDGATKAVTPEGYLHVWPEIFDCEGFFVACLEKSVNCAEKSVEFTLKGESPFKPVNSKISEQIENYYQQHFNFDMSHLISSLRIRSSHHEQQIWLVPDKTDHLRSKMRLQRAGIRLCDLIDSRKGFIIKTSHEFALSFGKHFNQQVVELNALQAQQCLKGDNISLDSHQFTNGSSNDTSNGSSNGSTKQQLSKGEVLMLFNGTAIGLAKMIAQGGKIKLKNNLPRELLTANADFFC